MVKLEQVIEIFKKYKAKTDTKDSSELLPAAVLMLIKEVNGIVFIVFTRRSRSLTHHKGEVSFPGGSFDPDKDQKLLDTALRETYEEIGVPSDQIEILTELEQLKTITGFCITPFIGILRNPVDYRPKAEEVAEVLEVPLDHLIDKKNHWIQEMVLGGLSRRFHYFNYQGIVIWGATGMILHRVLSVISPHIDDE